MARPKNDRAHAESRTRLLEAGLQAFRATSYADTGINEVLDRASVPKGSFYHYFRSKTDFGIAVAELVRAGTLPFVHNSGGQIEIVGRDARLIYDDAPEAAGKVLDALTDPDLRAGLRPGLDRQASALSTEGFARRLRAIVSDALENGAAAR